MLLETLLERRAQRSPDREALFAAERRISFGALETAANRLAHTLRRLGVRRGDRVAICLDNRVEAVIALFAALKADACFMMLNPSTKAKKLDALLDHAQARVLVAPAVKVAALAGEQRGRAHLTAVIAVGAQPGVNALPDTEVVGFEEAVAAGLDSPPARRCLDLDLAALLYTSGSTGDPKGVMLTHRNILSATESIVEYLHLVEDDVLFDVLPLSFGYGLTQLFSALCVGARLVAENGMPFPHLTLTRMVEERATGLAIVPTMATILLGLDLSGYRLSLRYLTNAGAGLAPEQARRLQAVLPGVNIVAMYGQTECLRALYLEPAELAARPTSVGRGMPNAEHFLIDESGQEAGPNQVGELVVRGAHVMRGYWQLPAETTRKLRPLPASIRERERLPDDDKALYTGDLFRRDADGYFHFVGRTDDLIKSRGEKVSPYEVERALYALDGVLEAAVVGVPDALLGQAIKAIVVLRSGAQLTQQQIRQHCARLLEEHMVPQRVEFRTELPKNDRGKIARSALSQEATHGSSVQQ